MSCELRITNYELRVTNLVAEVLDATNYELQFRNIQIAQYQIKKMRTKNYQQ